MSLIARFIDPGTEVRVITAHSGARGLSRADVCRAAGLDPAGPELRSIRIERMADSLPIDPDVIDDVEARQVLMLDTTPAAERTRDAYLRETVLGGSAPIEIGTEADGGENALWAVALTPEVCRAIERAYRKASEDDGSKAPSAMDHEMESVLDSPPASPDDDDPGERIYTREVFLTYRPRWNPSGE